MKENERNKSGFLKYITEKANKQISGKKQTMGEENYKACQYKISSIGND